MIAPQTVPGGDKANYETEIYPDAVSGIHLPDPYHVIHLC